MNRKLLESAVQQHKQADNAAKQDASPSKSAAGPAMRRLSSSESLRGAGTHDDQDRYSHELTQKRAKLDDERTLAYREDLAEWINGTVFTYRPT